MFIVNFLAVIFGVPFGFGVAFWAAATLLNHSNSLGDSHGAASLYTSGVTYTDKSDKMKFGEVARKEYIAYHTPKRAAYPIAPKGKEHVERSKK
ncbi:MAG: hypothetical protein J5379_11115 [Clostridiales bacterium]|nr:hypothetical protein [Clostridiales bacterium]